MRFNVQTKYGTVTEKNGWYYISSNEHGHRGKALHRVIFEDYHKCTLLPHANIHHRNFNKHDNRIENLQLLSASERQKIHKAIYKPSEMHKKAISKGLKGRKLDIIHRINLRRSKRK